MTGLWRFGPIQDFTRWRLRGCEGTRTWRSRSHVFGKEDSWRILAGWAAYETYPLKLLSRKLRKQWRICTICTYIYRCCLVSPFPGSSHAGQSLWQWSDPFDWFVFWCNFQWLGWPFHFPLAFLGTLFSNTWSEWCYVIKAPSENFRLQAGKLAHACVGLVCFSKNCWDWWAEGNTAQLACLQHLVSYSIREPWVVRVGDDCASIGCQIPETTLKAKQVDHGLKVWCDVADSCPCKCFTPKSREAEQLETSDCICWCFLGFLGRKDREVDSWVHGTAEPDRLICLLNRQMTCKECKGLIKHHPLTNQDKMMMTQNTASSFTTRKTAMQVLDSVLSVQQLRCCSRVASNARVFHLATAKWPRDAGRKYPWNCWRVLANERLWQRVTLMKISKEGSESTGFGRMIRHSAQNEFICHRSDRMGIWWTTVNSTSSPSKRTYYSKKGRRGWTEEPLSLYDLPRIIWPNQRTPHDPPEACGQNLWDFPGPRLLLFGHWAACRASSSNCKPWWIWDEHRWTIMKHGMATAHASTGHCTPFTVSGQWTVFRWRLDKVGL